MKKIKFKYVYTAVHEGKCLPDELDGKIEDFEKNMIRASVAASRPELEWVDVEMQVCDKYGNWATIYGDYR